MKMFITLMLISGFASVNAQATNIGRNDSQKLDCSKVIQTIQDQMKRTRSADAGPEAVRTESKPTGTPAQ